MACLYQVTHLNMSKKSNVQLSNQTPIYLQGDGWSVSISKPAELLKKELLASAKEIITIADTAQALSARNQRDDINTMLIDVEKYRGMVKKPVLDKGREIDQCASAFTMDLTAEKIRIDKLLGAFAQKEEEKRQAAAREAQRLADEALRIEQDRLQKEDEAEAARIMADRALDEAETKKERQDAAKAQAEALRVQMEVERLRMAHGQKQIESYKHGLVVSAPVMKGSAKPQLDFDVVDIALLYKNCPELVELTVKRREVLAELKRQQDAEVIVFIPGLKIKEEWRVR